LSVADDPFQTVLIVGWLILPPITAYHRIRSQATVNGSGPCRGIRHPFDTAVGLSTLANALEAKRRRAPTAPDV
jgi:hypothetical protein